MHNPFIFLSGHLLEKLIQEPMLFVREHYPRGCSADRTCACTCLLLTYYEKKNDLEHNRALFHLQQLKNDRMAFLYDSENEEHRKRLRKAATQPVPYNVYINVLETDWKPTPALRNQIHAYVHKQLKRENKHHPGKLNVRLKDRYGQLFLILSWKGNRSEVLLDDIENA